MCQVWSSRQCDRETGAVTSLCLPGCQSMWTQRRAHAAVNWMHLDAGQPQKAFQRSEHRLSWKQTTTKKQVVSWWLWVFARHPHLGVDVCRVTEQPPLCSTDVFDCFHHVTHMDGKAYEKRKFQWEERRFPERSCSMAEEYYQQWVGNTVFHGPQNFELSCKICYFAAEMSRAAEFMLFRRICQISGNTLRNVCILAALCLQLGQKSNHASWPLSIILLLLLCSV